MTPKKSGAFYLTITMAFITVQLVFLVHYFISNTDIDAVKLQLVAYGAMIAIFIIFMIISREKPSEFFGFRRFSVSAFFLTILYSLLTYPAASIIASISNYLFDNPLEVAADEMSAIVLLAFSLICAPVLEEFTFRGVILRGLRKSGKVWPSILLSAVAFGLFHGNITQFIYATVVGIFLGLLMEAGASVWLTVLYHFTFNFFGTIAEPIILTLISPSGSEATPPDGPITEAVPQNGFLILIIVFCIAAGIAIACLLISRLVLRKIAKVQKRNNIYIKRSPARKESGVFSVPLIIGIVMSALLIVPGIFV